MWPGRATMGSQRSEKRCSRPVSRILSRHRSLPFGSNDREDDHSSSPGIADGIQQPTRKPQAGRLFSRQERSPRPKCLPIWSCSVWGFACRVCYQPRGALLPHLFTLTHLRPRPFGPRGYGGQARVTEGLPAVARDAKRRERRWAVCFLCHCPSGCPARVLPGALPCGVRTFLSRAHFARQGP